MIRYEGEMVLGCDEHDGLDGIVELELAPRPLASGHLQNQTAEPPDVCLPSEMTLVYHLGSHPRDTPLDLLVQFQKQVRT